MVLVIPVPISCKKNKKYLSLLIHFGKQIKDRSEKIGEENLSKLEKIHTFQKKNASNELNIFFLKKIEEYFLR